MTKSITLPKIIYKDLLAISKELSLIAKKPISEAMTISLIIAVYQAYMRNPCTRDAFNQKIASMDFMSPEDFEKTWDELSAKQKHS